MCEDREQTNSKYTFITYFLTYFNFKRQKLCVFRYSKPVPTGSSVWWVHLCFKDHVLSSKSTHEDFNHKSADLSTGLHTDSLSPSLKHTSTVQPWRSQNDPLYYRNKKGTKHMYSSRIWSAGALLRIIINRFLLWSVLGVTESIIWLQQL